MAVTGTRTVSQIVTAALRKIGVVAIDEPANSFDMSTGVEALEAMLKSWQRKVGVDYLITRTGSLTLTTAASYTMSPIRPLRIVTARFTDTDGTETPMSEMTRDEYDMLPDKTSTGTPTQFFYDRQKEAAKIYVWPVLSSATTESISYTYERETDDIAASTDVVDMPGEWWECAIYSLADRLMDDYRSSNPKVTARAEQLYDELLAENRPESVFFYEN